MLTSTSVRCLVLFVSFLRLSASMSVSVRLSARLPVTVCACVCFEPNICASLGVQSASAMKVNAWIRAPATARDLESA